MCFAALWLTHPLKKMTASSTRRLAQHEGPYLTADNAGGREQSLERLLGFLNLLLELGGGLFVALEFLAAGLDDN